jgi:hypothetical protein
MSIDLTGPKGIMAARNVASPTSSASPPTYRLRRDCNTDDMAAVVYCASAVCCSGDEDSQADVAMKGVYRERFHEQPIMVG